MTLEISTRSSQENEITIFKNLISASQFFSEAVRGKKTPFFLTELFQKFNLSTVPNISLIHLDLSDRVTARFNIDFFGNRLVTHFQGEEKEVKLSCALEMIALLAKIFSEIKTSHGKQELSACEKSLTSAFENRDSLLSSPEVEFLGEGILILYPSEEKVVLSITGKNPSTISFKTIQNCSHLFQQEFAKKIGSLLDFGPNLHDLFLGIHQVYLGRCVLGLGKSIRQDYSNERSRSAELTRMISLLNEPGSTGYLAPLL